MARDGAIRDRAWAGPGDLPLMEAAVSAAWLRPGRPLVSCTVGDLEWWYASGGPDADWSNRVRVWERSGEVVGRGWLNPPASLDWFVANDLEGAEATSVRDGILAWATDAAATVNPRPVHVEAWGADGSPEADALVAGGWTAGPTELTQYHQSLDLGLDPPRVPEGFRLRSMTGPADLPARVAVHRAAFAPSKMTIEKYEILVRQNHYDWSRDIVVEAPDGSFAAFAMCWADPVGSVGEFEPVGVHPDHQRRGLGRVVMRHGLRLLRSAGIRDAIVFSLRSNAASEALYRSAGFAEVAIHRLYMKPLG
jgi:mycothiol synthase